MNKITTCFSPATYPLFENKDAIVVVIDIMRATTSICAALAAGAKAILPVGSVENARKIKELGYILAAERDGIVLDFADFGNSPDAFTSERVNNKIIAYSTTNGTQAIKMAAKSKEVIIASFSNLQVVIDYLLQSNSDVLLFCAGWKNRFSLEDSLCAGAIASQIIEKSLQYNTHCDSTMASIDLWHIAKENLLQYIQKAAHRKRLQGIVNDSIIEYCHTLNTLNVLPLLSDGLLINKLKL